VELLVSQFQSLRGKLRDRLVVAEQEQEQNVIVQTNDAAPEMRTSRRHRSTRAAYRDEEEEDDMTEDQAEVYEAPPAEQPRRTKKRIVQYRPLKKKQLQELCAKEGLSPLGSDKELIARHETFTNLYNSECDSFRPRPHQELLEEVKRREKARKDEAMRVRFSGAREHSHCMEQLKERRKEIGEVAKGAGSGAEAASVAPALTSGNPKFDLEVKTNFDKLIAKARQSMKKAKPSSESGKEKGEQEGESSEEFYSANSAETSVAAIDHTSESKVAGTCTDSKTTASDGPSFKRSNSVDGTEAPASKSELPEKLAVEPTTKRKATTTIQRQAQSKQKAIAPLPSLDRNSAKSNDRPRRLSSSGNLIGPWECQDCTFLNNKRTWSSASCEMCTAKRTPQPIGVENAVATLGGEENAVSIDC
jgi:hypothetical protein